jgi:sorting nexin-5/6/32
MITCLFQLSVRGKNKKEMFGGLIKHFGQTTDEFLLSATQKDVDEFFDTERNFLIDYHAHLKDATAKSDKMTKSHKNVSDSYIKISSELIQLATIDTNELEKFLTKVSEALETARVIMGFSRKNINFLIHYIFDLKV